MAETPDSFELRPPLALYVATAFVLAACLFFISASAASMAASWDVCSVVSGALLLPIPVLLGVEQYRAAFRYNARAARRAGVALALISGLLWCGGVTTVYEITADGWQWGYWGPLAILFGAACLNTLAAWANFRWSRRLREAEAQGTLPNRAKRFSLRELLFVMAGCSIVAAAVGYVVRTTPPPYAEHVSADQAPVSLPKGAYDVSYAQGYRGVVAYEFSCDESAFIEWVESGIGSVESAVATKTLHEIESSYTIQRFTFLRPASSDEHSVTIINGLFTDWRREDRGVYAAYDRTTGRGYYYFHGH